MRRGDRGALLRPMAHRIGSTAARVGALLLAAAVPGGRAAAQDPAPAAATPPDCPAGTARVALLVQYLAGHRAGAQRECRGADGALAFTHAFNDRGRGPSLVARYQLDAAGLPTRMESDGVDYFKSEVHERFTRGPDGAHWKSRAESGRRAGATAAYYVGYDAPPADVLLLARAALAAGGRLPLLPAGEVRVQRVLERTVESDGRKVAATLVALSGLDYAPLPFWLDPEGGLLAVVFGWGRLVAEGWEGVGDALEQAQREWEGQRARDQASRLARRPAGPVAVVGARVFDAEAAVMRQGWIVLFEAGRIVAVGPAAEVPIPAGAEIVDGRGKSLLPGLWDMHTHLTPADGLQHLAAGVTSVRDLANERRLLLDLERRIEAGEALGPRVVRAGFIDGPGPYQGPVRAFASTPEEVRTLVQGYAADGYSLVKLYSSLKPELVPVAAAETHRLGLRLCGHVPAFMTAEQAVRAGFDEIQHLNMLFLNFLAAEAPDTRTPVRFTAVAERAGGLDLRSPRVRAFLALLKERHVVVDPTVAIFESMFTARPGAPDPSLAAVADRLPAQVRRGLLGGGLPVPPGRDATYRRSFRAMLRLVRELHRQGIRLVAGTDGSAGLLLHRELELYGEAGIPPGEVLRIATLGAAEVAGRAHLAGSISPGKLADLVLVEGDPSRRLSDLRRTRLVVKGGLLHDAAALQAEVGVLPAP